MADQGCRNLCMGLNIHFPYFVETRARWEEPINKGGVCFSRSQEEDFKDYLSRAVLPALDCILAWLDSGESVTLSASGLAIEQLIGSENDGAEVLTQVMRHRYVDNLGQTYYRSVAGLFEKINEFIYQINRHADLVEGLARRRPQVYESTEFVFKSSLADTLRTLGFLALYSEGHEHLLSAINPNYVYSCRKLPLLLRNCRLSDDIAHRFHDQTWDRYPLTAEKYARWVAETPGDCTHIRIDAGIFSGARGADPLFREFFCALPEALHSQDVSTTLPSLVARNRPWGELQLENLGLCFSDTITSLTGIQNIHQQSAFWCLEHAGDLITDQESWRRLQSTAHFSRMAITSGSCGRVAVKRTGKEAYDYFAAYLRGLARCEAASQPHLRSQLAARALRCLPPDKAFHFHSGSRFTGYSAHSMKEFSLLLEFIADEVFRFHQDRGDFSRWITEVLRDITLARNMAQCRDPAEAAQVVRDRFRKLCRLL